MEINGIGTSGTEVYDVLGQKKVKVIEPHSTSSRWRLDIQGFESSVVREVKDIVRGAGNLVKLKVVVHLTPNTLKETEAWKSASVGFTVRRRALKLTTFTASGEEITTSRYSCVIKKYRVSSLHPPGSLNIPVCLTLCLSGHTHSEDEGES